MDGNHGLGPVSVVICNYNGEAYLHECLSAVARLRGAVSEVIVVDNASTDASLAIVGKKHPAVRVLRMKENRGPGPARNAGMRTAENRWVLALDNDALVRPDTLDKLSAAAMEDKHAAIVQPRSLFFSKRDRVHYDGGGFHYVGLIALRNFGRPLSIARGRGTVAVDCAIALALLVDRDVLHAIGGYDERFFILFEDLDLSYRLRARGYSILSAEEALVLHKGGTPGISYRDGPRYPGTRVYYHSRNRWLFLFKNFSLWTLLVASPGLCLYEVAGFLFALSALAPWPWLKGKIQFLAVAPRVFEERLELQKLRRISDRALLVGGPLTITPALKESWARKILVRALDRVLRAWWFLARRVLPH